MRMEQDKKMWLTRRSNFKILRPVDQDGLIKLINSGELIPQDEICPANGYWFALNDVAELRNHFSEEQLSGFFPKNQNGEITASTDTTKLDPLDEIKSTAQVRVEVQEKTSHESKILPDKKVRIFILLLMLLSLFSILFWFWTHSV